MDHPQQLHDSQQQITGLCGTLPTRSRDSLANQSQSSGSDDGGFLAARPPPLLTIRTRAQLAQAMVVENAHIHARRNGHNSVHYGVGSGAGGRTSWRRRPIINCPSQLSFRSDGSGQSYNYNRYSNILSRWYLDRHHPLPPHLHHQQSRLYLNYPPLTEDLEAQTNLLRAVPATTFNDDLRINTISHSLPPNTPYTPQSRISRVHASSPASSGAAATGIGTSAPLLVNSPWSPLYFSDLSSVRQPSSADRSFPTPMSGLSLRYMQQERELPALRTIHEETRRLAQGFMPLNSGGYGDYPHSPLSTSPRSHFHGHNLNTNTLRPIRSRLFPRQSRLTRTVGDLSPVFPTYPNNRSASGGGTLGEVEISPASRSSSSGFGSKNTSTQPNQSSHSAGSQHQPHLNSDWRSLPPYKPPPTPPISTLHHQYNHFHPYSNVPFSARFLDNAVAQAAGGDRGHFTLGPNWRLLKRTTQNRSPSSPPPLAYNSTYNMDHWLDLMQRVSEMPGTSKAVDVGSVDGAYEFDPATPTPTASTPTGPPMLMMGAPQTDLGYDNGALGLVSPSTSSSFGHGHHFRKRPTRYENIEARVQAMKEEFYAYKKRQAMNRIAAPLESAC